MPVRRPVPACAHKAHARRHRVRHHHGTRAGGTAVGNGNGVSQIARGIDKVRGRFANRQIRRRGHGDGDSGGGGASVTIADGVNDGTRTAVGRREGEVGAAGIDDGDAAGDDDIGDGQQIVVGAEVIGHRVNRGGHEIQRRVRVVDGGGRQAVEETVVVGNHAVGGDEDQLAVRPALRITAAVIAVRQRLTDDVIAGGDAGEGKVAVGVGQDTASHRFAHVRNAVAVHIRYEFNHQVRDVGFPDVVGAIAVRVIPHLTVDGGIQIRRRNVIKEVVVVCGGQRREGDGPAVVGRQPTGVAGQIGFHHDITVGAQVKQFVVAVRRRGGELQERAGRAAAGIGVKSDSDAGQRNIADINNAVGVDVIINVAGDGARRRDHAGGTG